MKLHKQTLNLWGFINDQILMIKQMEIHRTGKLMNNRNWSTVEMDDWWTVWKSSDRP